MTTSGEIFKDFGKNKKKNDNFNKLYRITITRKILMHMTLFLKVYGSLQ